MPPLCSILAARLPRTAADWYVFLGIAALVIACMAGSALWHRNRRKKLQSAMELLGLAMVLPGEPECACVHSPQKGQKNFQVKLCTWRKAGTMKDLRQIAERSRQMLELAERALADWRSPA